MTRAAVAANLVGAAVVFVFLEFVFPTILEAGAVERLRLRGAVLFVVFVALTGPLGVWVRRRRFAPIAAWLAEERPATERERLIVLDQPLDFVRVAAPFWTIGALVFGLLAGAESLGAGLNIGVTILLGGLATWALGYLLFERILRPVTARALASGPPDRPVAPGVITRLSMAWILATGVPVVGVLALCVGYLAGAFADADEAFTATLFLAAVALTIGLFVIRVAARSVADPITAIRDGLADVEQGDFDARVPIDDASEVGLLQAGFNRMASGLAERERIREAFGTYVDREVAEHILREGTSLAGEEVEVTMMFLDVRDFTGYAERSSATEVVSMLNRLFEVIVPVIHAQGGHVDKFVGDGLLAVFGAPRKYDDHADRALAAAVEIAQRVGDELEGELEIGIGLNSGVVVAGNVGGAGRLEFSVIGDAVNVAARVESATRQTGDTILIAERTQQLIRRDQMRLEERPAVPLKGKRDPVALYAPATSGRPTGSADESP